MLLALRIFIIWIAQERTGDGRMKKCLTKVAIALTLIITLMSFVSPGKASVSVMKYGLDYSSSGWNYSDSEAHLRSDFARFKQNNITLICLWLHWYNVQPRSSSSYDDAFLGRVKKLCLVANEYGIEVDIDFHSGCGSYKRYGLPHWFSGTFDKVATSSTAKAQWINMEKHVVQYLSSVPNIRSWQLFNEPWADTSSLQTSYRALFVDTASAVKALTDKPVTIRFGASSFTAHKWKDWAQLYQICDFLAVNWYPQYHTVASLDAFVSAAKSRMKSMEITEYGAGSSNDETQRASVANQISLFKARGIDTALICQYGTLDTSNHFNVRNPSTGQPRPAFYEVGRANSR
jgi:hypothetical protein